MTRTLVFIGITIAFFSTIIIMGDSYRESVSSMQTKRTITLSDKIDSLLDNTETVFGSTSNTDTSSTSFDDNATPLYLHEYAKKLSALPHACMKFHLYVNELMNDSFYFDIRSQSANQSLSDNFSELCLQKG